jgi:hypothetical protein
MRPTIQARQKRFSLWATPHGQSPLRILSITDNRKTHLNEWFGALIALNAAGNVTPCVGVARLPRVMNRPPGRIAVPPQERGVRQRRGEAANFNKDQEGNQT